MRRLPSILLLCVAGAAGICVLHAASVRTQISFLSNSLAEAGADETVMLNGHAVEVRGGAIAGPYSAEERLLALRLAYRMTAARRNPLLGLPSADPGELRQTAALLKRAAIAIAGRQDTPAAEALVGNGLYPTKWLLALANLEEARRAFLTNGDAAHADAYASAERAAADAYVRALDTFQQSFEKAVPEDIRDYAVPSHIISRATTLDAVGALRSGGARMRRTLESQEACVRGSLGACDPSSLARPALATTASSPLSAAQKRLATEVLDAAKGVPFVFDASFGTRLVRIAASACAAQDPDGAPLFAVRTVRAYDGDDRSVPLYVGNAYFLEVSPTSTLSTLPYLHSFAERGMRYVPMHPLIYYECPQSGRDQGAVLAVRDAALIAQRTPFSALAEGSQRDALLSLEARLAGPVADERDAAAYFTEAARIEGLPQKDAHAIDDAYTAFAYRGAGLVVAALDIAEAEDTNRRLADEGVRMDFSPLNLFFTRNGLGSLFMPEHPSLSVTLPFKENTLPLSRQPYRLYSDLRGSSLSPLQLLENLRLYHESYEF